VNLSCSVSASCLMLHASSRQTRQTLSWHSGYEIRRNGDESYTLLTFCRAATVISVYADEPLSVVQCTRAPLFSMQKLECVQQICEHIHAFTVIFDLETKRLCNYMSRNDSKSWRHRSAAAVSYQIHAWLQEAVSLKAHSVGLSPVRIVHGSLRRIPDNVCRSVC
jgi:hypothetical protein